MMDFHPRPDLRSEILVEAEEATSRIESMSRSGSIGTMWSSAEVPFILDGGSAPSSSSCAIAIATSAPFATKLALQNSPESSAPWLDEVELGRFLERHRTPPPRTVDVPSPSSDASPPWLSKLSPQRCLSSKGKRRPPSLHLQQITSSNPTPSDLKTPLSATLLLSESQRNTEQPVLPSRATEPIFVKATTPHVASPSKRYREPKGYFNASASHRSPLLFNPNFSMASPLEMSHSSEPVYSSTNTRNPPNLRYSATLSLSSSEGSSHGTDSGDVRTPESAHVPLSLPYHYPEKGYVEPITKHQHAFLRSEEDLSQSIPQIRHGHYDSHASQAQSVAPRSTSLFLSRARVSSRPSTTETAKGRSPRPCQSSAHLSSADKPANRATSCSLVRGRSRTLGSAERPHTSNLVLDAPGSSAKYHSKQRSIDITHVRRNSATDAGTNFVLGAVSSKDLHSSQPSPTRFSFTTEAGSTDGRTPRTPRSSLPSAARPKSSGGWAAHLAGGLQLRIDRDGSESQIVSMQYMSYDPFGRPDSLISPNEGSRPATPKRPKSRGSKDDTEESVGILHFAMENDARPLLICHANGPCPTLRHLAVANDVRADLLTRQAALTVAQLGIHEVSGSERKGRVAWQFRYEVKEIVKAFGEVDSSSRILQPISFACSAMLLDPERARKSRLLKLVKKQIVPQIVANPIGVEASRPSSARTESTHLEPAWSGEVPARSTDSWLHRPSEASSGASTPSLAHVSLGPQPGSSSSTSHESGVPALVPFKIARSKISRASLRSLAKQSSTKEPPPQMPNEAVSAAAVHAQTGASYVNTFFSTEVSPRTRAKTLDTGRRPATASELIKLQYLARDNANYAESSHRQALSPDPFASVDARVRHHRIKTGDDGRSAIDARFHEAPALCAPLTPPPRLRPRTSQVAGEELATSSHRGNWSPARRF